jgi:two-component system sensor histidine kinase/response regulator
MDLHIFDDIPIGLLIVKRDMKDLTCLYANRQMESLLGLGLVGRGFEEIWPSSDTADVAKRLRSYVPPIETTLPIDRNARKSWALLSIQETRHEGEDTYTIWSTDISASKEMEEGLRLAAAHADALSNQKSNFLATMSHEIRTPMQSVYGMLEMIELEKPSANILTMAQTARNSASGLLEILDDVLDFAKMDADQMELDQFEVPVRTLARGILEALSVKIQGKPILLKDDIDENVPFVIMGDPKRLRQIIINLMGNAMKFTHKGSVTIRITTEPKVLPAATHGLVLRFEIVDTGIGMSSEVASKLFRPFSQADNSTSRKYGGTGLGLSICRKLVSLMGGEIGVTSEMGKGSVFWFEIPTQEVSTDTQISDLPKLEGISVLSVEDHPMGAKEIVKSLKSMGATVESCSTYKEAIELIKRRPFDVGIVDQGLPDGLGLDLVREIMQVRPFMGLIMYTVRDDAGLQHSLQSLGVSYLTKPASRKGLGEAVRDAASKTTEFSIEGPRKLIIAEDTASVRDVLQRQLDILGVDATFVENGREALYAVRSGEYGILLTDLHMPEMDGYELVRTLREDDKNLDRHFPIIVLTADVQMSERSVYLDKGFDECLLKPVSLGQFRRLLIRWGLLTVADNEEHPISFPPQQPTENTSEIDKDAMIQQMGAFDENAIEMLKLFIDMTEPLVRKIQVAEEQQDHNAMMEHAHSLKGAARSACLNRLGNLASELQDDAENKKSCTQLVQDIVASFEKARAEINAL